MYVVYFSRLVRLSAGTAIFEIGYTLLSLLNTWLRSARFSKSKRTIFSLYPITTTDLFSYHFSFSNYSFLTLFFFYLKSFSFIIVTFYNFLLIAAIRLILLSLLASPPPPPQHLPHPLSSSFSLFFILFIIKLLSKLT